VGHFRALARRRVQIPVVLRGERSAWERPGRVIDIHLGGAGIETDEPLTARERVSIAFATPTLWDPLVLSAAVAWAHPLRSTDELDALGRTRAIARAGLRFDYPTPDAVLAMYDMIRAIAYE
jgi:hypothetical protein